MLLLDNSAEDFGTGGVVPEVFFYSLPKIKHDGSENRFSAPRKIVAVEVAYRETIYFSVPNLISCKGLEPLGDLLYSATTQSSRR